MQPYSGLRRFCAVLIGYAVAWSFGSILGTMFWLLVALGFIKVRGYRTAIRTAYHGNVIIASNHPSLLETFLIPAVFWPGYLMWSRFFVWSMPDQKLFPPRLRWLYTPLRCLTVDRSNRQISASGTGRAMDRLRSGECIVIHPEAGRTIKGTEFLRSGGRRIRRIHTFVPDIAARTGASILPVYVTMRRVDRPLSLKDSIVRMFRRGYGPIIISFGEPYCVNKSFEREHENKHLERSILSA